MGHESAMRLTILELGSYSWGDDGGSPGKPLSRSGSRANLDSHQWVWEYVATSAAHLSG